jgi:hypothetical protein
MNASDLKMTSVSMSRLMDKDTEFITTCDTLSGEDVWSTHDEGIVWKARKFIGSPSFYPVYRYEDFYSYSLLALILLKGSLEINRAYAQRIANPDRPYYPGNDTIDRRIVRVGGPLAPGFVIKDTDEYARKIAAAMTKDAAAAESCNPGCTNIILCGGKDSLNLLLLPWNNPVLVASAPPNYELVCDFVRDNGLKFNVIKLEDRNDSLLEMELLLNCCQNDLIHFRWGYHLKELTGRLNRKSIIWKGQLGSMLFMTDWKVYTDPPYVEPPIINRTFKWIGNRGKHTFNSWLQKSGVYQRITFRNLWRRGAMWQGTHMSFLRQLTDTLVLSGYHGSSVQEVVSKVDLNKAVQNDIRPLIGRYLHGGPVSYPAKNLTPPRSVIRQNASGLKPFLKALSSTDVRVQG